MTTKEKKEAAKDTPAAEEKSEKKLNSRKFLIWLFWTFLIFALIIIAFIRNNDEIIIKAMEFYFIISASYMGANCITKGIYAYKDIKTEGEK